MLKAIDIFNEWAKEGRDVGMEKAHEISVSEMIDFALEERANIGERFNFFAILLSEVPALNSNSR